MQMDFRTIKKVIILVMFYAISISCQNNSEAVKTKENSVVEIAKLGENQLKNDFSFLDKVPEVALPKIDSTNFDNFDKKEFLTTKELSLLNFDKVILDTNSVENVAIHYKLKISDQFKTYVFVYNKGKMEQFSILVNYDNDFNFIDSAIIAYDEIAESFFRTTSKIMKDKIMTSEFDYTQEAETLKTTTFEILKNGKIKNL